MMKLSRETWILLLTGAAAAAALALGVAAFRLARHEEEFRKEELRSLLKSECRLFAGRCRQALDAERRELAELAAGAVPSVAGIREAVGREPLFTAGFLARRDGTLLYPEPGSSWARRYGELFAGLVSARDAESTQFSNVVMPSDSALLYQTRNGTTCAGSSRWRGPSAVPGWKTAPMCSGKRRRSRFRRLPLPYRSSRVKSVPSGRRLRPKLLRQWKWRRTPLPRHRRIRRG